MSTSRLDPNSTRNPETEPAPGTPPRAAGHGGTAPDRPKPPATQDPAGDGGTENPVKISDWESEGGSPGDAISSTKSTPPKESGTGSGTRKSED
jgi:hypothetical protein